MQHFHEEHIISTYNTKAAQKRRERLAKTNTLLESFDAYRDADEMLNLKKEKALKESFYNTIKTNHQMAKNNHAEVNQKMDYMNEQVDNLARDLFFYVVYESLNVDNMIKNSNFQYIRESCNEFYNDCKNQGILSIKEGSGFDDIFQTGIYFLKEELIENNSCDLGRVIENTVNKENFLTFYATESISLKTAKSIKDEKKSSILKEQLINEEKYVDPSKSLFRYLLENNIQEVIDETTLTDPEDIQNSAMLETILDYTIMEAANTLELVKFTNLKTVCNTQY